MALNQTKPTDSTSSLRAREQVCIMLKVPESGTPWIDELIQKSRELDAQESQTDLETSGPLVTPEELDALIKSALTRHEAEKRPPSPPARKKSSAKETND